MATHRKILILTLPGQGFINPSLRFANRLLKTGVHVTFSTSLSVIRRIDKQTTAPGLTFAPFSDGHDNGKQPTTTLHQFDSDFATNAALAIVEIIKSVAGVDQPFDHLVYTTGLPWAARVADAHGVKSTLLWCQPAILLDIYYYYFNGYQDLISSNNNDNDNDNESKFVIKLPGLLPMGMDDMPSFCLPSILKEHEFYLPLIEDQIEVVKVSPRILVNTFSELESESITAIDKLEFLPIGPLISLDEQDSSDDCIQWLNSKPKASVVYVSFGTVVSLSMEQVEEIANGLLESEKPFLWVIRDSEQVGRLSRIDELRKQGMIVDWCSQMAVLSHDAIGCFVMHGGWNSTVESLTAGVRMVVFPQWSDQGTNAKMIEDVWKTGVRVKKREGDGMVEGKEIKRCVEMVMGDDEMRRNAEKWRDLAREALNEGGSSTINLKTFLDDDCTRK